MDIKGMSSALFEQRLEEQGRRMQYLDDREKNLRRGGAQGHQSEVGHSLVPDSDSCYCG